MSRKAPYRGSYSWQPSADSPQRHISKLATLCLPHLVPEFDEACKLSEVVYRKFKKSAKRR